VVKINRYALQPPVGIVDILISGQTPEHRLPEKPVKPIDLYTKYRY
jgi:hypothetical protein